jgi:CheY-like chemotaxis protein
LLATAARATGNLPGVACGRSSGKHTLFARESSTAGGSIAVQRFVAPLVQFRWKTGRSERGLRTHYLCRMNQERQAGGDGSRGRILVVDDNHDNIEIIATRLQFRGYDILSATDGAQALQSVKDDKPDLILLDVMLPDIDGYEISRRIKNDSELPFIPISLVRARDTTQDIGA